MAEYIAALAPDELPDIQYVMVNDEQMACMQQAIEDPENQANFEVAFLPVETPEQRQAAAEEWAIYLQTKHQVSARNLGAFMTISSRDESPEAFVKLIESKNPRPNSDTFVVAALSKIVKKNKDVSIFELLHEYYQSDEA